MTSQTRSSFIGLQMLIITQTCSLLVFLGGFSEMRMDSSLLAGSRGGGRFGGVRKDAV